MTFEENVRFLKLLKKWLYSSSHDDFVLLLKFLEVTDSELFNKYNHISLDDFYEIRRQISHIPNDLFFELYRKHYALTPANFTSFYYDAKLIPKKRAWWQRKLDFEKDKAKGKRVDILDYFDREKTNQKIYWSVNHLSRLTDKPITDNKIQTSGDFATFQQLEKAFSKESGFYIGGGWHFDNDGHLLTVGGSGAGKGVNFIIPALLSPALVASGSSVVVLDPKGENLAICGEYLRKNGYNVLSINPFDIPEISSFGKTRFNPFSLTSKNDIEAPKFCDLIAECLIPDNAKNDHWNESARQYISLYLLYLVATDQANFKNLFEAVRLGGADRLGYLAKMKDCKAFNGIISATAGGIAMQIMASKDGNNGEIESIFSTVKRGTDTFKHSQIIEHLAKSDFDLTKLAHEKTALFVCVNPAELQIFSSWLRVFFGCVFRSLQRFYNPNRRVLLLLDEFPQIGRLREFEMAFAYMRGYNVTVWAIVQDLSQLKKLYWDSWETFVGSAAVKMWLPLGADNFTIDYLENRLPLINSLKMKEDKVETEKQKLMSKFDLIMCQDAVIEARGLGNFARFEKIPYWSLEWGENASPNPFRK